MENTKETLRSRVKHWWWYTIIGIMSLVAGIAIYARPAAGYLSLSILFSLVMMISGISEIFFVVGNSSKLRGWGWNLASGILDFTIGTFLWMYPAITMATLPFIVGFWLLIKAFYLIGISFDLRNMRISGWGWLLVGGILVLGLGFLTIYNPAFGALKIIAVSGAAFIVAGISNIFLSFELRNVNKEIRHVEDDLGKFREQFGHA